MALQKIFLYFFLSGIFIISTFAYSTDQTIYEQPPSFSPEVHQQDLGYIADFVEPSHRFPEAARAKARGILLKIPTLSPELQQQLQRIAAVSDETSERPHEFSKATRAKAQGILSQFSSSLPTDILRQLERIAASGTGSKQCSNGFRRALSK